MTIKKLQALKAKKGFTLVELIVVIAIIAVLAAILIPILLNWVTQSNISAANGDAKVVFNAVSAAVTEADTRALRIVGAPAVGTASPAAGTNFTRAAFTATATQPSVFPDHLAAMPNGTVVVWFNARGDVVACRVARGTIAANDLPTYAAATGTWTGGQNPQRGRIYGTHPERVNT